MGIVRGVGFKEVPEVRIVDASSSANWLEVEKVTGWVGNPLCSGPSQIPLEIGPLGSSNVGLLLLGVLALGDIRISRGILVSLRLVIRHLPAPDPE